MAVIRRLLSPEQRSVSLPRIGGSATSSSVSVTPERSLQISSVYSCIRLLSESIGSMPVGMFEKRKGVRQSVEDGALAALFTESPNPTIDAGELWRTVIGWMALRGNAYIYLQRNGAGLPMQLWPVAPTSVNVKRVKSGDRAGELAYELTPDESSEYVPVKSGTVVDARNMLHYRAFGLGVEGLSPIGLARESIGISFAAQAYIGGFFARDASPSGVLSVPGALTEEQYDRLDEQWKSLHRGFSNSHELAILEGGAKWEGVSMSPADAAFLEVQNFSRKEIAGIFGVPPHMIGDQEKSTSWGSGIEQMGIGFVRYSLTPWLVRLERVTKRALTGTQYMKWNVDGLMRSDMAQRYAGYGQGRQWGWLSANDIRALEDMDPIEGGDEYLSPTNMVPVGQMPAQRELIQVRYVDRQVRATPAADEPSSSDDIAAVLAEVFAAQHIEAIATGMIDRDQWDGRLADGLLPHATDITRALATEAAAALGGTFDPDQVVRYLEAWAAAQAANINLTTADAIQRAKDEVAAGSGPDEEPKSLTDLLGELFAGYATVRVAQVANGLTDSIGWFARTEGSTQAGAVTKTWITGPNPRPSHAAMSGETVGIKERFSNGMRWPHDRAGGVDEVAGCNCSLSYSKE